MWFVRLCMGAVLSLTAYAALAENWVNYAIGNNGTEYSYDRNSLKAQGRTYYVWVMQIYSRERKKREHSTKIRYVLDCDNQAITTLTIVDYEQDGSVINNVTYKPYQQVTEPIIPGSVGNGLHDTVCG